MSEMCWVQTAAFREHANSLMFAMTVAAFVILTVETDDQRRLETENN